jgi:hypothetical protein
VYIDTVDLNDLRSACFPGRYPDAGLRYPHSLRNETRELLVGRSINRRRSHAHFQCSVVLANNLGPRRTRLHAYAHAHRFIPLFEHLSSLSGNGHGRPPGFRSCLHD